MTDRSVKILVVDDVAENRDLLIRRLQRLGFKHIDQAENGVQALAAIAAVRYDLVLLDIMMPELDGFGVLEALKRDGLVNDLPVIVISALSEIEPVVRCVELGAVDFIFKPFNPTLLRARVLSTLEKKALSDRTREELLRKQHELNAARALQLSLVPPPLVAPASGGLTIDVMLEPAKEVGGDLVDYFRIGDDLIVIALGDVSDKGAGAALMMARTHAMVRSLAGRPDAAELFRRPGVAAGIVNAALAEGNSSCMFVTFLLAVLECTTGRLSYVRAGHVPPFHRNGTGSIVRLDLLSGPPFGIEASIEYRAGSATLSPGDRLLAVTDGVTEAIAPDGRLYGDEGAADFLAALEDTEPHPLASLLSRIRSFETGQPASDDIAAVLLTFGRG